MRWQMSDSGLLEIQIENADEYLKLKRLRRHLGGEWAYGDAIPDGEGNLTQLSRVLVKLPQILDAMELLHR